MNIFYTISLISLIGIFSSIATHWRFKKIPDISTTLSAIFVISNWQISETYGIVSLCVVVFYILIILYLFADKIKQNSTGRAQRWFGLRQHDAEDVNF
jgi:hypothetical protein